MSVIMELAESSMICPRCGDDTSMHGFTIEDPNYGKRNGLPKAVVLDISETGSFDIIACSECGFKWIANEGMASTSQLKSLLISHFIHTLRECSKLELEQHIDDLSNVGGIPTNEQANLVFGDNDIEVIRFTLLACIERYIDSCDVDTLVELYNDTYNGDVSEACETTDTDGTYDDVYTRMDRGAPIHAKEVLCDD